MFQVGFLLATAPDDWKDYIKAFTNKLNKIADVTVLPPKGSNGNADDIRKTAEYMVDHFDVIVTAGTLAALICKDATNTIRTPVVFASVGDAGLSGLDMPEPGRWYTGGSNGQVKFVQNRVDHMLKNTKDFKASYAVVGYYKNDAHDSATHAMDDAHTYLQGQVGATNVKWGKIQNSETMAEFVGRLQTLQVRSLYCCSDLLLTRKAAELNNLAVAAGMATMWEFEEHKTIHNGTDYLGVSFKKMFEEAAGQVIKILNGDNPDSIPIYQPALEVSAKKKQKSTARHKR
jgi:hypothetical protein